MELPEDTAGLKQFARELIDQCLVSRETRRMMARLWRQVFYTGSMSGAPSRHNRCYSHIDKLSSFLFSPAGVRFTIEFDSDSTDIWALKAERAARYLNRKFNRRGCGTTFSMANMMSLVEGSSFVKMVWGARGLEPWVIPQSFIGVLREDIAELDRQEAFVHSFYVTPWVFKRMIAGHPDRDELAARAHHIGHGATAEDLVGDSYFHQIVAGGFQPLAVAGTQTANSAATFGAVGITASPAPLLAPEVAADLICVHDLWVWDDKREDWTTIRLAEPDVLIEGQYRRRNLSDIPKRHPFVKVSSSQTWGYFFGRSELATVLETQNNLTEHVNDIRTIMRGQAKPPRAFSGFQGITDEKARALLAAGGVLTEQAQGAKVESLAPEMPAMALEWVDKLEDFFDDAAGFTNILSGQGEPGVRAGVHAGTLLRTSTPRLRDRALLAEGQCADFGGLALAMLQQKDATILMVNGDDDGEPQKFLLSQLPEDAEVTVDSHTSSPAFSEDARQEAYALAKAGVIDGQTLIEMTHPPREDLLKARLDRRQREQAKFAAEHPELVANDKKK